VKSGVPEVSAPVYSHLHYDILPGEFQVVRQPDIMIVEGLNVLQTPEPRTPGGPRVFVSDFFDFSVYVDARPLHIQRWYIERFLTLRETAFQNPESYFHRYAALTVPDARKTAQHIWTTINGVNLRENIQPTRTRADLILEKGPNHTIERVHLRKI
jgi:type I pantothenate kinase